MAIEKKEIEYAKQLDDVFELVVELMKVVRAKGNYAELVDELIDAVTGVDEIKDEVKNLSAVAHTAMPRVFEIIEVFKEK
jgi:hypothetical protein